MSELTVPPTIKTDNTNLTITTTVGTTEDITMVSSGDIRYGNSSITDVQNSSIATWTTQSTNDNDWLSVTWSPGLFCAVASSGTANRAMTSPDGITWTTRTTNNNDWTSVTWSPELELFCAVASSGTANRAMTSPDGITWTTQTTNDNNWTSVTWSPDLSLFCAVASTGTANRVMTSPDGINWQTQTTNNNDWTSVTWSPGLFCAVASTGTADRVMTSPDGITWTTQTTNNNDWTSVTWSPELELFCAVASLGTGNRVMTSPDGITWTTRASANDNDWTDIVWSPQLSIFVAVSETGGLDRIMSSPDGIVWTTRSSSGNNFQSITWSPQLPLFVAVANSGSGDRVITNTVDYSDYTQNTILGTQAVTNVTILGNQLDIGQASYQTNIGIYASEINIGSLDTRININGHPYSNCGFFSIKYSNQSVTNGATSTILFEENIDADNQGYRFGYLPPRASAGVITINRTGIYNIQAGYHSDGNIGATGRILFSIENGGNRYSALDQINPSDDAGGTTSTTLFLEEGDTFEVRLFNGSGSTTNFCTAAAPCTLFTYLVSNSLSNNTL